MATAEQIKEWKSKYGDVFLVEVDGKSAYLKKPDRKTMSLAMFHAKSNPIKFQETLLNGCWLLGDEEIKTDDSLFFAVAQKLDGLLEVKEAELKKL